jgi:hypothetical protein
MVTDGHWAKDYKAKYDIDINGNFIRDYDNVWVCEYCYKEFRTKKAAEDHVCKMINKC